jgi:hypothetical protein
VVDLDTYGDIDYHKGTIELSSWTKGKAAVTYLSGFPPEEMPDPVPPGFDPEDRVLQNIPEWLKLIVINYVVQWFRTSLLSPRVPKEANQFSMQNMLQRQVMSAVYVNWSRPRNGVLWGDAR